MLRPLWPQGPLPRLSSGGKTPARHSSWVLLGPADKISCFSFPENILPPLSLAPWYFHKVEEFVVGGFGSASVVSIHRFPWFTLCP